MSRPEHFETGAADSGASPLPPYEGGRDTMYWIKSKTGSRTSTVCGNCATPQEAASHTALRPYADVCTRCGRKLGSSR